MSYAVWSAKPPFTEADLNPGEKIYQVGDKWVVTDQGKPDQASVDAVLTQGTREAAQAQKKAEAFAALQGEQLHKRAKDADAPAAVKAYAEAIQQSEAPVKVRG